MGVNRRAGFFPALAREPQLSVLTAHDDDGARRVLYAVLANRHRESRQKLAHEKETFTITPTEKAGRHYFHQISRFIRERFISDRRHWSLGRWADH